MTASTRQKTGAFFTEIRTVGKGMPAHLITEAGAAGKTFGKEGGSGLGLSHAKEVVQSWHGHLQISSAPGEGTSVFVTLPRQKGPVWFIPAVEIQAGQTVVVLDDDSSVHQVWKSRLAPFGVTLVQLYRAGEMDAWIGTNQALSKSVLMLVDFELLGSSESGLDLIERHGFTTLYLTTGHDHEKFKHLSFLKGVIGKGPIWKQKADR